MRCVVVVDRDRQCFLGLLLPDDVLVQHLFDLRRCRNLRYSLGNLALFVFREDLVAERDALVADVDGRAGNELRTESFDFPQNEQRRCLSWDMAGSTDEAASARGAQQRSWAVRPTRRGRLMGLRARYARGQATNDVTRRPTLVNVSRRGCHGLWAVRFGLNGARSNAHNTQRASLVSCCDLMT